MATTTAKWAEGLTLRAAATLAAGATEGHDLDLDTAGYDTVTLQFNIAHSSSTGVTVNLFSSPDSGTTDDNQSLAGGFTTDGTDVIKTVVVMAHAHIRVSITNDDGSNATGNISILYAGRQWETV